VAASILEPEVPAGGRNNAACPYYSGVCGGTLPSRLQRSAAGCSSQVVAPARDVGSVRFEIEIPDDWPPSLGFAVAAMIRQSLKDGFPIVIPVRRDTTPDQLEAAFDTVRADILRAGLAA